MEVSLSIEVMLTFAIELAVLMDNLQPDESGLESQIQGGHPKVYLNSSTDPKSSLLVDYMTEFTLYIHIIIAKYNKP